jgi:acyl-CoA thioesterase-1
LFSAYAAGAGAATILIVGDSLSAGYGMRQEDSWPALLARRLQDKKLDFTVANASTSGETTSGGRNRFDTALRQHRPKVVVLALGANDGLRGLPVTGMRDNLATMIKSARDAGASVLLVGMRMPPNYGPDYTRKFHQVYTELAHTYKAPLVPFLFEGFADKREYFQADGIHPGPAAQPLMLDNVWAGLQPLLRR